MQRSDQTLNQLAREIPRATDFFRGYPLGDEGSCWPTLYPSLNIVLRDLMDQIHQENNVLFHRVDGVQEVSHA